MSNEVVVSGIGCLSPIGVGIADHETAIEKGLSGLPQQDDGTFFSHIGSVFSLIEYSLAASGALSTAFACLQLRKNIVAPVVNSQASFLENELSYVKKYPLKNTNNICLVNSFDYFGATTSLVLRKGAES